LLNRLFPGEANGGPTAMIAHYIESVLLAMSDAVDLHSGGCVLSREATAEALAGPRRSR
jgi:uncharacterized protein